MHMLPKAQLCLCWVLAWATSNPQPAALNGILPVRILHSSLPSASQHKAMMQCSHLLLATIVLSPLAFLWVPEMKGGTQVHETTLIMSYMHLEPSGQGLPG